MPRCGFCPAWSARKRRWRKRVSSGDCWNIPITRGPPIGMARFLLRSGCWRRGRKRAMTTIIETLNNEQIAKVGAKMPEFGPGDTLRVNVKVIEGTRERVQAFEGVCI